MPTPFHGDIFVSPASMLKLWRPDIEKTDPALFRWASSVVARGDVVWDIGANVGLFSFAAASVVGPDGYVLAIEPDTWLSELLRRSARTGADRRGRVDVLTVAVSDSVDVVALNIAARGRAANYIQTVEGSTQTGGVRHQNMVMTVTLDWLLERFPAPDVLKIDIEGAEVLALVGGAHLLGAIAPIVICEVRERNAAEVTALLTRYGYELFDAGAGAIVGPVTDAAFNTLAWPMSRGSPPFPADMRGAPGGERRRGGSPPRTPRSA
jgi:FkbM family methyltransferase